MGRTLETLYVKPGGHSKEWCDIGDKALYRKWYINNVADRGD